MKRYIFNYRKAGIVMGLLFVSLTAQAERTTPYSFSFSSQSALTGLLLLMLLVVFVAALVLKGKADAISKQHHSQQDEEQKMQYYLRKFSGEQIRKILEATSKRRTHVWFVAFAGLGLATMFPSVAMAQIEGSADKSSLLGEGGIIITITLLLIPVLFTIGYLIFRLIGTIHRTQNLEKQNEANQLVKYLSSLPPEQLEAELKKRQFSLDYQLSHHELSGTAQPEDKKGLIQINEQAGLPIVALKKKALPRPNIDPQLSKLVLWYLGCAAFWLLFGTTIGEYVGIKFVAPDADHVSWLSFGRLRPVHTNVVFWGWASLGMLGLAHYIVPRVGNVKLASIKMGWYALWLINAAVILGSLALMAGINNGGGEYREYIWPIMLLFGIGVGITLVNFLQTIARRTTKEIYISNWYMVSAIIFGIVIMLVAYIPYWQNGLGETIAQGYYMHQGVGMWFMFFTLGIVYYFLPQQLNKPIYSYSLGILAFWTQILFYTLIGTHHFVFSAIPWWLQTVAIVGSMGMVIPVLAGTTNFLMTFKGAWYKVRDSYTLPFFLVGIIFYFTGSLQGTAEAFRSTNLIWHFTDFTVAHSHLTMYGIISFFLWASIYAVIPRLTGKEAPQITVGAHFWLALIGMLFYTIPLMLGSTLRGSMWMEGKPFIDSVVMMAPYWLWRAVGGSLMWLSHVFFVYNMYKMMANRNVVDVREAAIEKLTTTIHSGNPIA